VIPLQVSDGILKTHCGLESGSIQVASDRNGSEMQGINRWFLRAPGDTYLRTLLIAGARAVVARAERSSWITRLLERRHYNVVVVALAYKMARTAWAVLAKGAAFDKERWNPLAPMSAS
jgi:predicted GTPase